MAVLVTEITELIGDTPLLELTRYGRNRDLGARIVAKLETFNPIGSVKDRIAWAIIRDAEERGELQPGGRIVDLTSGNTGIALAAIAASRGYGSTFYAGDNISADKVALLRAFGADVIAVPNTFFLDPDALVLLRERARTEHPDAYFTDQLANPVNPQYHYDTTGPEIWKATGGSVDILVGGVGTGGTLSGTGRFLKENKPGVQVVVAEPGWGSVPTPENPYPKEIDGVHKITEAEPQQVPDNFDQSIADEYVAVETADAYLAAQALAREEGVLAGSSAGAILHVATQLAQRPENVGKTIVAIVPDSGERYLSAGIYGNVTAQDSAALPV
ncbi:PLP-dependent cysteine synthase family protein [Branchiibius sp. NY16-3462-2]|uniref:PLP-dependent cysteine synthase family protein n=1 Tax=Branchiibius sp. NY16-3462-2 TaxID=1807500 RepID=UPI000793360F|nr:cysteine synthase family protein [Branchiibius sp. NY16-3462-2]KYH45660.1 cysteine synthase [Branchiibius sp. NY16-3462-2]